MPIFRPLLAALLAFLAAPLAADPPPDLVLVTIDTLRADAPGFAGNTRVATPLLDRLAKSGRVFTDAHAHNVVTLPSHTNILTGLYPFQHGVRENSGFVLPEGVPTLATVLAAAGYRTAAFVSGFPLDSRFGLARGFAIYDDRFTAGEGGEQFTLAERRGDATVTAALGWWKANAGGPPRFLWLHLFDPHAPYAPPEPFASRYAREPYLGEVAAVDTFLAPFLAPFLEGRERPALIAVTADHGESLGEHGEATHGLFAYEATLKVPLVLWGRGVAAGADARPARHVDLFPTLLAAAGVAAPPLAEARPGRDLLRPPPEGGDGTYFEALSAAFNRGWAPLRGFIAGGWKLIALPLPELYELPRDPGEKTNRVDDQRRQAKALGDRLPAASAWPLPRSTAAPAGGGDWISAEDATALAALGYVADRAPLRTSFGPADDPKNLIGLDQQILATIAAYSERRLDEAVRLARQLVAARPAMPLGRSLLAQALLEAGDGAQALEVMLEAKRDGAASESLLRQLGLTLAEKGRSREAIALLEPLAERGDADARVNLALAYSEAGQGEKARDELAEVLRSLPDDARALEMLAMIELRRENPRGAREAAERSLEIAPGRARAGNYLGAALYLLGEKAAALEAWQRAVDSDPRLWDAWWNLGMEAGKLGRPELARRALEAFAAGAPPSQYASDIAEARRRLAAPQGTDPK